METKVQIRIYMYYIYSDCRSQWPCGLRRRTAAAPLLKLWVRIPPGAWMFVCCECCVLSGRGLCDELITRPEDSYQQRCVVVCDLETSWTRRPWSTGGLSRQKQTKRIKRCKTYYHGSDRSMEGSGVCIHLVQKRKWGQEVSLQRWYICTRLYGVSCFFFFLIEATTLWESWSAQKLSSISFYPIHSSSNS